MVTRDISKDTATQVNADKIGVLVRPGMTPPVPPTPPTYETTGFVASVELPIASYALTMVWVEEDGTYHMVPNDFDSQDLEETLWYRANTGDIFRTMNKEIIIDHSRSNRVVDGHTLVPVCPLNSDCLEEEDWDDVDNLYMYNIDEQYNLCFIDQCEDESDPEQTVDCIMDFAELIPFSPVNFGIDLENYSIFTDEISLGMVWVYSEADGLWTSLEVHQCGDYLIAGTYWQPNEQSIFAPVCLIVNSGDSMLFEDIQFTATGDATIVDDTTWYNYNPDEEIGPYPAAYTSVPVDEITTDSTFVLEPFNVPNYYNISSLIEEETDPGDPGSPAEPIPVNCVVSYSVDGKTFTDHPTALTDDNNVICNIPRYMYLKFSQDVTITEE